MSSPIHNDRQQCFIHKNDQRKRQKYGFFQLSFFVDYSMYVCQLDSHDDVFIGK